MPEKSFNEQGPQTEHIPSKEKVQSVLEELAGKEYETERQYEDEKGLYLWTIKVVNKDQDGYTEYEYTRKGHYKKNDKHGPIQESITSISVTAYDKDNVPFWGTTKAKVVNGEWEIKKG